MKPAARTASPHRAKALEYLRSGRVVVRAVKWGDIGQPASPWIHAVIDGERRDPTGQSVRVDVRLRDGWWNCDEHPGRNDCAHRLAVQMVTGHGHLDGRWSE